MTNRKTTCSTEQALEFERATKKEITTILKRWDGVRHETYRRGRIDREECMAAALCIAWAKRCPLDEAVRLAVKGGDIGTGTPLESDLSARRLGYRPVSLRNAVPYAEHYALAPDDVPVLPIREQTVMSGSRLSHLIPEGSPLFDKAWTWLDAKVNGATHPAAGAACGKEGSARAREGYSNRMEAMLQQHAIALGYSADYDTGSGRRCAKAVPTRHVKI